jgi:citrate lyase beta subunit
LPLPPGFSLAGRLLRAILVLPIGTDDVACPPAADALAILAGNTPGDWSLAAQMILRHRQVRPEVPVLIAVDAVLDADDLDTCFAIILPARPDGLIVTGVRNGVDLQRIDVMLSVAEAVAGLEHGATALLAIIGDNPAGLLDAGSLAGRTPRLKAIGRNATVLAAALGTGDRSSAPGDDSAVSLSRGLTVLAAAKAGVAALDWIDPALEGEALSEACARARADGFGILVTENPEQLSTLAAAYR